MDGATIGLALQSLSALSDLLSAIVSIKELCISKKLPITEAVKEYQRTTDLPFSQKELETIVLGVDVISPTLLAQVHSEAQDCEKRHIEARRQAITAEEREQIEIRSMECMCSALRSIKKFNGGQLPANTILLNWWASYGCTN